MSLQTLWKKKGIFSVEIFLNSNTHHKVSSSMVTSVSLFVPKMSIKTELFLVLSKTTFNQTFKMSV